MRALARIPLTTIRWTIEQCSMVDRTGEVIDHSLVSVTQLRDGEIFRWHDYSNIANITDNAPSWRMEELLAAAEADA